MINSSRANCKQHTATTYPLFIVYRSSQGVREFPMWFSCYYAFAFFFSYDYTTKSSPSMFHLSVSVKDLQLVVFIGTPAWWGKNLTRTCQFSAITLLTRNSCGLLLLSSLSHTLQSSERAYFIAFLCVHVWTCTSACTCVYICVRIYVCACMCQKLNMILSLAKALDHPALLTTDLTVQLN